MTNTATKPNLSDTLMTLKSKLRSNIAWLFVVCILLFSSIAALISTGIQLFFEYKRDISAIQKTADQIDSSHKSAVTQALWAYDMVILESQLQGIKNLPGVLYAGIHKGTEILIQIGQSQLDDKYRSYTYPLWHDGKNKQLQLGVLEVKISLSNVYERLWERVILILLTQTIKTFCVSIFILFLFYLIVGRHLKALASFAESIHIENLEEELVLNRKGAKNIELDELGLVESAFNNMRVKLLDEMSNYKQSQEALRQSEERFQLAMQFANDGLFDWNLVTNDVYFSPVWKSLLGYADDEIANNFSEWQRLTKPEDVKTSWTMLNDVLNGKRGRFENEFKMRHKDGHWVDILSRANVIFNDAGKGVRVVGTHVDITERKRTENMLRKNESLLQRIFEILPIGLWLADKNGNLIKGNPAGIRIWGAEPHVGPEEYGVFTARRLPSMQEITPDDWALAHTIRDGVTVKDELLEIDAFDGKKKTILNYTAPVLDHDRNVEAAVIVNLDISDRVKAEREALESQTRLSVLVNTIPDLIWLKDPNGVYLSCNPTFERFFGAAESEIRGKTDYDFVDKKLADFSRENDRKAERAGGPNVNEEWLTFKADGYHGLFETIKTPMHDIDGDLIGILGIARDITKRHQAEQAKLNLERQLKQSQKMESIGNLAGGIAHDFNNILSAIIGFTELALEDACKGSSLEDSLLEVYAAGKRAKELVKQILAFARQSEEKRSPIKPGVIAKEVLTFIRSTIPATIDIHLDIQSDALIIGNATQIHQILMNLCTNAAQAMEESGGVLKLSIEDIHLDKKDPFIAMGPGNYVKIYVSDSGVGIAPEVLGSIFDPYFTTKGPGKGTGMGLAMAHGIVESYGGKIMVDSRLGIGTTFTIYLPISQKSGRLRNNDVQNLPLGTERILFVDDEDSVAKMGSQMLARLGYSVTTRTSSIEALKLFQAKPNDFDLVMTDMTMPNLTGDKLAVALMNIRPDIPVIICTGYSKKLSDDSAAEIGIKAFAYKPIVKADLAKTVRKVLDDAKK